MRPREKWSSISRLPAKVAAEIELERRIELIGGIPIPFNYPAEGREALILSTMDRVQGLNPSDAIESMLAVQIASAHAMAMACYRRANEHVDNAALFGAHANSGMRLSTLFIRQMAALKKYRGEGEQKVIVKYVNAGLEEAGHCRSCGRKEPEQRPLQPDERSKEFIAPGGTE